MTEYNLKFPLTDNDIKNLKIGDILYVSGPMIMARDEAHARSLEYAKENKKLPVETTGIGLFHCGPVVVKSGDDWIVKAAGPTTSTRMNLFEPEFIEKYRVKVIIGKGGMDKRTSNALKKFKAVYCAFPGGAGVIASKGISDSKMKKLHWSDLGTPEALWEFTAEKFGPLIVAMDSHGDSLYDKIKEESLNNIKKIEKELGLELLI